MNNSFLHRLEKSLAEATPKQQRTFLMRLPRILDLSPADLALLKAAEPAFTFWDNPHDDVYDAL